MERRSWRTVGLTLAISVTCAGSAVGSETFQRSCIVPLPERIETPEGKRALDPFRSLVSRPEPVAPTPVADPGPAPTPVGVAPLGVRVAGYASEGDHNLAILEYRSEVFLVEDGWESEDGAFSVPRIERTVPGEVRVHIHDRRTGRRFDVGLQDASAQTAVRPPRCGVRP